MVEGDDPDRAIRFFEELLAARPRSAIARVQLAISYMYRTPDRELGSVRKGLLASEALKLLEEVAAAYPDSWGIHYAVGLIHLDWFTKLKHVPFALEAFERCLTLQKGREREKPYYVLVYQALGDALVKDLRFPHGRKVWKDGQDFFPDDRGLADRMGLTALMVTRYVEDLRSWATAEDTWKLSQLIGDLEDLPAGPSGDAPLPGKKQS